MCQVRLRLRPWVLRCMNLPVVYPANRFSHPNSSWTDWMPGAIEKQQLSMTVVRLERHACPRTTHSTAAH